MSERVLSPRTYFLAYAALVVLTLTTVGLSFLRMGEWHIVVGTAIGVTKVAVVALFFMHLVRSPARTWLAAAVGLYWLHILIALMMTDYFARRSAAF